MAINVMLLVATDDVSGPMKGIVQLIENINDVDCNFYLYNFKYRDVNHTNFVNYMNINAIPVKFLIQNRNGYFSLIRQVLLEVNKYKFDVIQTHGFKPTFVGFFSRLFCGARWVCFMHGATNENLKIRIYNLVDNLLQLAAHRTVLVSEAQRKLIYGGSNTHRVHVLNNAVDMNYPMPLSGNHRSVRKMFNLPDESKIVVTIGRFSPEKGIDILLDSFFLLVREIDNIHLVLVGDGQERAALEAQVRQLKLTDVVHFAGYTKTPGDYMADANVFVLSSRSEGIPNVVLEAMAMGKPVVATAVGGVPEIIEDGINGRLVSPEQPHLLAQVIAEVLTDHEQTQRLALAGKKRVQDFFSIDARVAKLKTLYIDLL